MNFLKALGATILTLLLFLSLAVFSMLFTLNSTILNPDFIVTQMDRLDIVSLVREVMEGQTGGEITPETEFLEEAMYDTIAENEPWLKQQLSDAIYVSYDYLLGESETLTLKVSLEPLKVNLRDNLWQLFQQNVESLSPELATAPPEMQEQYFDEFYQQFAEDIPSVVEIDESLIPPEVMAQIIQARQYISYARMAYYGLIALMVLLVAGIILLHRSVKGATRELGITFLIYGALEYASVWATQNYLPTTLPLPDIPPYLQTWLTGFINDFVAPLQILGIGLMVGGAALIIVSIVYPRWRREAVEE